MKAQNPLTHPSDTVQFNEDQTSITPVFIKQMLSSAIVIKRFILWIPELSGKYCLSNQNASEIVRAHTANFANRSFLR